MRADRAAGRRIEALFDVGAPFHSVVLAGGRSRRFGSDKRRVVVSGTTLLSGAVAKLREVTPGTVFGVCATLGGGFAPAGTDDGDLRRPGSVVWLADDPKGCGPVGGILAAFSRCRSGLLVLACDVPVIAPSTLRAMAAIGIRRNRAVARLTKRGWEPLVAFYPAWMAREFRAAYRSGIRAPHVVLERCGAIRYEGAAAREFANVNRTGDIPDGGTPRPRIR